MQLATIENDSDAIGAWVDVVWRYPTTGLFGLRFSRQCNEMQNTLSSFSHLDDEGDLVQVKSNLVNAVVNGSP